MSIVFTNPNGRRIRVNPDDVEEIEPGVFTAMDPETGMPMLYEEDPDNIDPDSMEAYANEQYEDEMTDMMEEVGELENPPKALFTWRNLRLPQAIAGEKVVKGKTGAFVGAPGTLIGTGKRFLRREISAKQSIRESPFLLQLTTAEQWYDYISNMARNPVDMGAELSAGVSPSQKIAVAMFVKEAEMDPGFTALLKKAVPGAEPMEIVAMGQMVFDLMTGKGPNPLAAKGYGTFKYDKMFRLAYDILQSMPIRQYNSYTLFQLEADEGGKVFNEVTRSYTPLDLSEVGLVLEIRDSLAQYGSGYANMVISEPSLAAEAAALMQKAAASYASGDTITVRSILNYLQASPFYYKTLAAESKNIFEAKSTTDIAGVKLEKINTQAGLGQYVSNGLLYLKGIKDSMVNNETGKLIDRTDTDKKNWQNQSFEVVKSPFDTTVVGVIKFDNSLNSYSFAEGATMAKNRTGQEKKGDAAAIADVLAASNPRGKPTGRGKYFNLEIHGKGNLKMKLKPTTSGGQGDLRHGAPPKGNDGSQNTWTKGLYKLLQADIEEINKKHMRDKKTRTPKLPELTVMVSGGKHKKTGKWAPYRIKLPKSHFATSRLPDGTQSVGLRSGKATPAMKKAWRNFTDEYGIFVRNDNKGTEFRFTPSKKAEHRGAYQDRFRRQVGGAKRSR